MGLIYLARSCTSGKGYVGQTVRSLEDRRSDHEKEATAGSSLHFHRALRKYGFGDFEWSVLLEFTEDSQEELDQAEIVTIASLCTYEDGYNMTRGGDGFRGEFTPEHRAKLSRATKGRKQSPEWVEKRAAANRGLKRSEKAKAKMREARRRRPPPSAEQRAKVSAALKGVKRSAETSAKRVATRKRLGIDQQVSAALTGIKRSEETKQRMSEAQKLSWQKRKRG